MAKEQNKNTISDLPKYIEDLLVETPSAITKLCALWDGLTAETQVKILSEIKAEQYSGYFTDKIYVKAVKSKNPYVRYLAAKDLSFGEYTSDEVNVVERLIKEDTDPLVKYSLYEKDFPFFAPSAMKNNPLVPDAFFKLPHQARLAVVRSLSGYGKDVAAVIRYAIDNCLESNIVTEQELFDILLDYVGRDFREQGYSESRFDAKGNVIYIEHDDIEALWKLVPDLPISCAYILVTKLPGGSTISEEVANKITEHEKSEWLLESLLYRYDIELGEFRK